MITTCSGHEVADLLERIRAAAWIFSEVTLCSPFIGPNEAKVVVHLLLEAPKLGCGVRVITTEPARRVLLSMLPVDAIAVRRRILKRDRLHAKFYLAVSRRPHFSEVIVTSANLTSAGLSANDELGVRATNSSEAGVALLNKVANYAQRLAS